MMSIIEWYRHKSDQSLRLAKRARHPIKRSNFQTTSRQWTELAQQAAVAEGLNHEISYQRCKLPAVSETREPGNYRAASDPR